MNKENARQPKPTSASEQCNSSLPDNLRYLRVIHALLVRSRVYFRSELDRRNIAGWLRARAKVAA
jgi:hypothetical protein